jgi:protein-tyrosine phosphatase
MKMQILPFKKSYWILPGKLLVGEVPTGMSLPETKEKLNGLKNLNVSVIINLMEDDETNREGDLFYNYEEDALKLGMKTFRFSIEDVSIPSKELMDSIINQMHKSIQNNDTIYVHCWGGVGRTGTVVGCFLKKFKYATNENVFEFIDYLKRTSAMNERMSPETSEQMNFVLNWN